MVRQTRDGGIIPSGIPTSSRGQGDHFKKFGLHKGQIVKVVYPEEDNNLNGSRVEYVIKVNGQEYPNAVDVRDSGAIYNYQEKILKEVEYSYGEKKDKSAYEEKLDAEFVYVLFLNGNGDFPIIIGCAEHPKSGEYRKNNEKLTKRDDKVRSIREFNGIEFEIDKDSNLVVTHVGRKDPNPDKTDPLNKEAVGTYYKMYGNGDVELNIYGKEDDQPTDLRMMFTKETKKFELFAQESSITMDEIGVNVTDKFGNIFVMDDPGVKITDKSGNFVEMKADTITVKESGGATLRLGSDKVGLGGSSAELLEKISEQLDELKTLFGQAKAHTHLGNLGYPTAVPDVASAWATAEVAMGTLKGDIDGIKGGI